MPGGALQHMAACFGGQPLRRDQSSHKDIIAACLVNDNNACPPHLTLQGALPSVPQNYISGQKCTFKTVVTLMQLWIWQPAWASSRVECPRGGALCLRLQISDTGSGCVPEQVCR